jgi:toxin ParE1/3/4
VKDKPVIPRALANRDVDEAIAWYLNENAAQAALGLVDALERAYSHIARHPATGSARYALEMNLPGLRSWPLKHYPYLVFYVERGFSMSSAPTISMSGGYCTLSGIFPRGCWTNPRAFDGNRRRDHGQFRFQRTAIDLPCLISSCCAKTQPS